MKRDRIWWESLTKEERSELVYLEKSIKRYGIWGSAYLPEGYNDCQACGIPTSGNLCGHCLTRLIKLIDKANKFREASRGNNGIDVVGK